MKEVNLLIAGSFNPVTIMHLRMMEIARDHLREHGIAVRRGFVSPVHDGYSKEGLLPIAHRSAMLNLALESSDWIELSLWESQQPKWTPTYEVLHHHHNMSSERGSNSHLYHGLAKKKKLSTNASNASDVNCDPCQPVQVMFVCGADVLASFSIPNLWSAEHMEKILLEHGLVVITRIGYDIDSIIYENDLLHKHRKHIMVVREFIENSVSSTKIRRACSRGLSIKYLVNEKVEEYIQKHKLYSSSSKPERVENAFGRIRFSAAAKPARAKNSKKTSIVSKTESVKKSVLENKSKVERLSRRSKNIVKRSRT